MILETPIWPLDRFECRELMSITELEAYAPHAEVELFDDEGPEDAEQLVGGYEAWCKRERQRQRRLQSTQ